MKLSRITTKLDFSVFFQWASVIFCLLLLHGAFAFPALATWMNEHVGRHPVLFWRIIAGLITLVLCAKFGFRRLIAIARRDALLLILCTYVVLTVVWSMDRAETASAVVSFVLATLLGVYIAGQFRADQQLRLLVITLTMIVLMSLLTSVFVPSLGVMTEQMHLGRWNGILGHKNQLGYIAALCDILLIYLPHKYIQWPRAARFAMLVVVALVLFFTESLTAQIILAGALAAWPLYVLCRDEPRWRRILMDIAVTVCVVVGLALLWNEPNQTPVDRFGRSPSDASVTGRLNVWQASITMISMRPILGYGYQTIFAPGSPIFELLNWSGWESAHNIVLDTLLHLGLIGLVLFFVHYGRSLWRAIRIFTKEQQDPRGFAVIFLLFFVASSLLDGNGLAGRNIWWVMYVAMTLNLSNQQHGAANPDRSREESHGHSHR